MNGLFDEPASHALPLEDADISYATNIELGQTPEQLFKRLYEQVQWREESITVWGKSHLQPRLFAWYGDAHASYRYSGIQLTPLPWLAELLQLRDRLARHCNCSFNSVLVNLYRNERDSMGMHADDEAELGPQPVIASLSLGEQRRFVLKHKYRKELKSYSLTLGNGSLVLMRGDTQRYWKHGVPKESRPCGPRINLTFRNIG
ncbi:MAG: alpha-ketoglutarate-dependent dioxygenase AlkB [Pseudomonadales bacterium]